VVDENVPIVANDSLKNPRRTPQANGACILSCIAILRTIVRQDTIVLDDFGEVLERYRRSLSGTGQPGTGDAFFKFLFDNQYNPDKVRRIVLNKNEDGEFEAFPTDQSLANFDRSDRIFVSLALTAPERPVILNAVDSDYSQHLRALTLAGVRVEELCPDCIRPSR
jgi:hypothetical protein